MAGADVLYAPGLKTLNMVRTVCGFVSRPVNVLLSGSTILTVTNVTEAGAERISVGGGLTWTTYGQMVKVARQIAEDGVFNYGGSPGFGSVGILMKAVESLQHFIASLPRSKMRSMSFECLWGACSAT